MEYPSHLSSEQHFQRLIYIGALSSAEPAENFATWLLTGTAAILGLILVNIDTVSNILSEGSIRWGLSFMTISILFGAISKYLGIAIHRGIASNESLYSELNSPQGAAILENLNTSLDEFATLTASPFLWPIKGMMIKAMKRGAEDVLTAEKLYIKMFCILIYSSCAQCAFGIIGLIWLVCGIK